MSMPKDHKARTQQLKSVMTTPTSSAGFEEQLDEILNTLAGERIPGWVKREREVAQAKQAILDLIDHKLIGNVEQGTIYAHEQWFVGRAELRAEMRAKLRGINGPEKNVVK